MSDFVARFAVGGFARDTRFAGHPSFSPPHAAPACTAGDAAPDPLALAYARGHDAGRSEALAEAGLAAQDADATRERFAFSFARLDGALAEALRQRLHETVVALCEETLRPLALDPAALALRIERAVAMFARADDERVIRLHPDDHAVVASLLPGDWAFAADPALARGALRVETQSGGVEDGPEQWRTAIIEALRLC